MAISEADLRRILTTEERNVLVMCGRARGADELRLAARSLNLTPDRVQVILGGARTKIERETRKGGRGVTTVIEEVKCGCGVEFTPRRKGELLCPACRELNGDDGRPLTEPHRSNGRSDHREPDHESAHESAHEDAPEASPEVAPHNGDVARNPPPARPFPSSTSVEERRARVVQAVRDAGGECKRDTIRDAVGYGDPALGNDVTAVVAKGLLVKVPVGPRRALYRTPERDAEVTRREMTGEGAPAKDRRELILDYIAEQERVSTMDVTRRHPSVTYQTIKNDLDSLHREGKLVKLRGSAIIEWRMADGEAGEPPYYDTAKPQAGLTDAERAAIASAGSVVQDDRTDEPPPSEPEQCASPYCTNPVDDDTLYCSEECKPGNRIAARSSTDPDPEPAIESAPEVATEERPDEQIVKHVNVGQSISEEGRLAVELHTSSIPPENETPEQGVEPPAIDVLRQRAADTAQQLMAEAERLAEAADAAIPETLLRARYIAALLGRIEQGDTSPDLLDRFERLAFEG